MILRTHNCAACGESFQSRATTPRTFCNECITQHRLEGSRANTAIFKAVKAGVLPKVSSLKCSDCDRQAEAYDHRDYTRPLEVEPVCTQCNGKRGPAYNSVYRPSPSPQGT